VRQLGRVPHTHRTDNLSAATHDLKSGERAFNERYLAAMAHYGVEPVRSTPYRAHENGDVEQGHYRFKRAVEQALLVRGSRNFDDRAAYESFLASITEARNRRTIGRVGDDLRGMKELPPDHTLPVRVGEHEVVQQVIEPLAPDGDPQIVHRGEVALPRLAGPVLLREHHLPLGPVQPPPLPHTPLQRSQMTHRDPTLPALLEQLEDRLRLEPRRLFEHRGHLRPDRRQRILPRPIAARAPRSLPFGSLHVPPRRLLVHPCSQRRLPKRRSFAQLLHQSLHLSIADHPSPPFEAITVALPIETVLLFGETRTGSSNCRYPGGLIVAEHRLHASSEELAAYFAEDFFAETPETRAAQMRQDGLIA
jgi:hypothetical protein